MRGPLPWRFFVPQKHRERGGAVISSAGRAFYLLRGFPSGLAHREMTEEKAGRLFHVKQLPGFFILSIFILYAGFELTVVQFTIETALV